MHDFFMKHGVFSWNELMTSDLDSARSFYGELFGWKFKEMEMDWGGTYVIAMNSEDELAGMLLRPKEVPSHMPSHWGSYITVDDVDKCAEEAEEKGGIILNPPTDIPDVGRACVVQDPQGAVFSIITYTTS